MSPPIPYARHVAGMNCIGPRAPASLALRTRPNADSTKLTAASTDQWTPKRRCASAYAARRSAAGAASRDAHLGGLPRGIAAMWRRAATVSRASPRDVARQRGSVASPSAARSAIRRRMRWWCSAR